MIYLWCQLYLNKVAISKKRYIHTTFLASLLSAIHSSFTVSNAFTLYHHHLQFSIPWPQVKSLHRTAVTSESTSSGSWLKPNVPRLFIPRCRWYSGGNITKKYTKLPLHILTEIVYFASFLNFKHYNSR